MVDQQVLKIKILKILLVLPFSNANSIDGGVLLQNDI